MSRVPLAVALCVASLLPLAAFAGTPIGPYPGGMHCVVVNDDSCTVGPFVGVLPYGWGIEGVFVGDLDLIQDAGGYHHDYHCTNIVLVGILMVDQGTGIFGNCDHIGEDPPLDIPVTMTCLSHGVGIAICTILD